ncbi:MAG TPA: hypothetical protein VNT29_05770, partial [Candidatus Limnocylindrales bacterium]|nr:hypothetical protein [Candidatus Limnocylindrales bacterium]
MATPSLAITHIAAAQNQKEVTANDAFDALDNADNAIASFANTNTDMTLTQLQLASGGCIKITGAITADRHVNLPAGISRSFIFLNATTGGHNLIVQVTGAPGTIVSLAAAAGLTELFSDGTNVTALTGGSGVSSTPPVPVPDEVVSFSGTSGTLANTPSSTPGYDKVRLYRNGVRQLQGGGNDFTV